MAVKQVRAAKGREPHRLHGTLLSAFSHRDFTVLWVGALVSNVGTWMHQTALNWLIWEKYHSSSWVGVTNFIYNLPVIFLFLLAGSFADLMDRRRLLIVTQAGMGLAALSLAILVTTGTANLLSINISLFMMGLFLVFTFPAWQAILPELVDPLDLLNAVALNSAQWNAARFAGPFLAGPLLALWSPDRLFYINALSYLAVIFALLSIKTARKTDRPEHYFDRSHMTEGVKLAWRNRWARTILLALGTYTFFGLPYLIFVQIFATDVLGGGSGTYGVLLAASGLGAVLGAFLITALVRRVPENQVIKFSGLGIGVCLLLFCFSTRLWLSMLLMFLAGAAFLMTASGINSVLQLKVEAEIRARVMSLYVFMLIGTFPVGGLLMGVAAGWVGIRPALATGAAVCLATALLLVLKPMWLAEAVVPYELHTRDGVEADAG
ncbi:MAG: MFS transporter [Candidatus Geothermincolia bacterium]